MKNFIELAEARYSVRKFMDKPVSDEHIEAILHGGHVAPTGCNSQPQRIFVFKSAEAVAKVKECTRCHFDAPSFMLVCYHKDECWYRPYDKASSGPVDASIVCTHMMLRAWELGVGSCWVMHFKPDAFREKFNIPEEVVPVALLTLGYPAEDAVPMDLHSKVRPMEEVVTYL